MQRSWDAIRRILLKAKALPTPQSTLDNHQPENDFE